MLKSIVLALATSLCALPALAHDYTLGNLQIVHPTIPTPAENAKVAGGFLTIVNSGAEEDKLLSAKADFAMAQLHKSEVDASGMAKMTEQEFIAIPANETVVLEHGGLHVMFMGLTQSLAEGSMVPVTLVFEKAGEITVDFAVEAAAMDHTMHTNP